MEALDEAASQGAGNRRSARVIGLVERARRAGTVSRVSAPVRQCASAMRLTQHVRGWPMIVRAAASVDPGPGRPEVIPTDRDRDRQGASVECADGPDRS
jgi:hypothetical protein